VASCSTAPGAPAAPTADALIAIEAEPLIAPAADLVTAPSIGASIASVAFLPIVWPPASPISVWSRSSSAPGSNPAAVIAAGSTGAATAS